MKEKNTPERRETLTGAGITSQGEISAVISVGNLSHGIFGPSEARDAMVSAVAHWCGSGSGSGSGSGTGTGSGTGSGSGILF